MHVERLNGGLRDWLAALTRKTHAFAKRDATWDALVGLQLFDHNFHRTHRALHLPLRVGDVVCIALIIALLPWLWELLIILGHCKTC